MFNLENYYEIPNSRYTFQGFIVNNPSTSYIDKFHKEIQVLNIGRRWDTNEGRHILVMDQYNKTYHLFFQRSDLCWYIIKDIKPSPGIV